MSSRESSWGRSLQRETLPSQLDTILANSLSVLVRPPFDATFIHSGISTLQRVHASVLHRIQQWCSWALSTPSTRQI